MQLPSPGTEGVCHSSSLWVMSLEGQASRPSEMTALLVEYPTLRLNASLITHVFTLNLKKKKKKTIRNSNKDVTFLKLSLQSTIIIIKVKL